MATSPNQQGGVGADSGAIWMWTEACVILPVYSPFKMTFCFVDLLRRHLFLSFYNASPLLSTFFLISPACWYLVAQLVGKDILGTTSTLPRTTGISLGQEGIRPARHSSGIGASQRPPYPASSLRLVWK